MQLKQDVEMFFVERNNNDTKKYKIIHPFDGRMIPLRPQLLIQEAQRLSDKLNLQGVDYVVGFAEGGVLSAYGVAHVSNIPLVCSYRVRLKAENEITFTEPHSERARHYVYGLKPGNSIVIVEDEITTGRTLLNAIEGFSASGIKVKDIGTFVMNGLSQENRQILRDKGHQIKYLYDAHEIKT